MSEPREQTVADIVNKNEVRHAAHLERAEYLEDGFGICIDELRAIYGNSILNCFDPNSEVIEHWITLCDTLRSTDKAMVALINPKQRVAPGCHGLSQRTQYESAADVIIITNPHEAEIAFEEDPSGKYKMAILRANGYTMLQPSIGFGETFSTLTEPPKPLDISIATGFHGITGFTTSDLVQKVVAGDTYGELYETIADQFSEYSEVYDQLFLDQALNRLFGACRKDADKPWEKAVATE